MERTIITTNDGSQTIFVPEIEEHYHSVKGACTESQHIFINMGLKASKAIRPSVLEIGFGTGLNAFLTLIETEKAKRIVDYVGLELYPLEWDMIQSLDYQHLTSDNDLTHEGVSPNNNPAILEEWFKRLHQVDWEIPTAISPYFTLHKIRTDAPQWLNTIDNQTFDVVYFDAFSPEKQPEMWTQEVFNALYGAMNNEGILMTYCAHGSIRRMLQGAGFTVERLPGPPSGKREILRATRHQD